MPGFSAPYGKSSPTPRSLPLPTGCEEAPLLSSPNVSLTAYQCRRTIIDYSRVLVIDAGRVVEFDSPKALLEKEDGAFLKMCRESSDFEELLELAGVSRK